jgi:hypothetical protein
MPERKPASRAEAREHAFKVAIRVRDKFTGELVTKVLYEPQPNQVKLHNTRAPNLLYGGAAGGGKSHAARWHGIMFCMKYKAARVLLLRRKFKDLQQSHLLSLRMEVPEELAKLNKSEHIMYFDNKSVLVFGHCNTEGDFASYLSSEWDLIIVDEAGQFTPWMLQMLPSRLRTTKPNILPQYVICTNPGGVGHLFIKSRFVDKEVWEDDDPTYEPHKYTFIQSFVQDNKYINREYVERLKALPDKERQAYLYGNWEIFVGQVFTEWRKEFHIVRMQVPKGWRWYGGMDWGMRNPGAFYLIAVGPDGDVYVRHELYFKDLTAYEAGTKIGHMLLTLPVEYIACDSSMADQSGLSAPTLLEECQMGIQDVFNRAEVEDEQGNSIIAPQLMPVAKGPGSRFVRQQLLHRYLAWETNEKGELKISKRPRCTFHPDCKHAVRTIPALPHDENKPEEVDTESEDHAYDAITYFLMSRPQPSEGPKPRKDYDHTHPGLDKKGVRRISQYEKTMREMEKDWDEEMKWWKRSTQTEEAPWV